MISYTKPYSVVSSDLLYQTVLSKTAEEAGLSVSLFERLEKLNHEVYMLNVQYRMHPGKFQMNRNLKNTTVSLIYIF
jgi:hypothetical protein